LAVAAPPLTRRTVAAQVRFWDLSRSPSREVEGVGSPFPGFVAPGGGVCAPSGPGWAGGLGTEGHHRAFGGHGGGGGITSGGGGAVLGYAEAAGSKDGLGGVWGSVGGAEVAEVGDHRLLLPGGVLSVSTCASGRVVCASDLRGGLYCSVANPPQHRGFPGEGQRWGKGATGSGNPLRPTPQGATARAQERRAAAHAARGRGMTGIHGDDEEEEEEEEEKDYEDEEGGFEDGGVDEEDEEKEGYREGYGGLVGMMRSERVLSGGDETSASGVTGQVSFLSGGSLFTESGGGRRAGKVRETAKTPSDIEAFGFEVVNTNYLGYLGYTHAGDG